MTSYGIIVYSRGGIWVQGRKVNTRGFLTILVSKTAGPLMCWFSENDLDQKELELIKRSTHRTEGMTANLSTIGFTQVQKNIMDHQIALDYKKHLNVFTISSIQKYAVGYDSSIDSNEISHLCQLMVIFGPLLSMMSKFSVELPEAGAIGLSEAKHKFVSTLQSSLGLVGLITDREEHSLDGSDYTLLNPISEARLMMCYKERELQAQPERQRSSDGEDPKSKVETIVGNLGMIAFEKFARVTSMLRAVKGSLNSKNIFGNVELIENEGPQSPAYGAVNSDRVLLRNMIQFDTPTAVRSSLDRPEKITTDLILSPSIEYETLLETGKCVTRHAYRPCGLKELNNLMDSRGVMKLDENLYRTMIFKLGLTPDARLLAWGYLLGVYPFRSTRDERNKIDSTEELPYAQQKSEWMKIMAETPIDDDYGETKLKPRGIAAGDEDPNLSYKEMVVERYCRIMKDVCRLYGGSSEEFSMDSPRSVCRSYLLMMRDSIPAERSSDGKKEISMLSKESLLSILMYYAHKDNEVGYVQGMSDIISVVGCVYSSEYLSCLIFENFMEKFGRKNFSRDQSGINKQLKLLSLMLKFFDNSFYNFLYTSDSLNLFFCFRWILVFFKREFSRDEVISIWDTILSCPITSYYHLFIALAIINKYRKTCAAFCVRADDVFRFFSNLDSKISAEDILVRAESLSRCFVLKFVGEVCSTLKPELYDADLIKYLFNFATDTGTPIQGSLKSSMSSITCNLDEIVTAIHDLYDSADKSPCSESELLELMELFEYKG